MRIMKLQKNTNLKPKKLVSSLIMRSVFGGKHLKPLLKHDDCGHTIECPKMCKSHLGVG